MGVGLACEGGRMEELERKRKGQKRVASASFCARGTGAMPSLLCGCPPCVSPAPFQGSCALRHLHRGAKPHRVVLPSSQPQCKARYVHREGLERHPRCSAKQVRSNVFLKYRLRHPCLNLENSRPARVGASRVLLSRSNSQLHTCTCIFSSVD